jgi:signal transduction histidine kinase
VLRTSTFRLALIYLALFGVSALCVLGFVYWNTEAFVARQTDETIRAEITGLGEQYRLTGIAGLTAVVIERSRNQRDSLYLLATRQGRPLAGNLDSLPDAAAVAQGGWVDFSFQRMVAGAERTHLARARLLALPEGFRLLVGRDVQARVEFRARLREAVLWGLGLTLALGLAGGVLMSRRLLRRVETVNAAARGVSAGDLGRRVALDGSGDELDQLGANVNAMLDRIGRLLDGMRQVTDNIAHDLRGPLHRMRTRLEVTLAAGEDPAAMRAALEDTVAEAEALLNTFNALLLIAELDAGAQKTEFAPLDLGALVRDVADLYAPLAEDQGLALTVAAEEGLSVAGERHLLSQAVSNLIDNAIKYTPRGGTVAVAAGRGEGGCVVAVTDTGPGIPAADRDRVQDRFVRLEASRHRSGSGLGLSLVRAVARVHGGSLGLGDRPDGDQGLHTTICIPALAG